MSFAAYFTAKNYGNSTAAYLGFQGNTQFLAGMATSNFIGNLPARAVRLYGAFRPGVVLANTILTAFPVLWGKSRGMIDYDNVWANKNDPGPTNPHLVPPYGNTFVFT
jgi:hypothetical protein